MPPTGSFWLAPRPKVRSPQSVTIRPHSGRQSAIDVGVASGAGRDLSGHHPSSTASGVFRSSERQISIGRSSRHRRACRSREPFVLVRPHFPKIVQAAGRFALGRHHHCRRRAVAGRLCGRAFQGRQRRGADLFAGRRSGVPRHRARAARGLRARSGDSAAAARSGSKSARTIPAPSISTSACPILALPPIAGYYADGATALRFAKPVAPRASAARLAGTAAA